MTAAAFLIVVMFMVVMMTAATLLIMVMVVMVFMLLGMQQVGHLLGQGGVALQGIHHLLPGQLLPRGGHQGRLGIMLPQDGNSGIQFCLGNGVGTGKEDGGGGFDLIVVELAKILAVNLYLACVGNCHSIAQGHIRSGDLLDGTDDIGQLAHAGRLDQHPVRMEAFNDLLQGLAEVAHQGAADAAGVHLGDFDTGVLEETAVNADFTELVFNQNQGLSFIPLLNHFLDEGGLAGTQEAGINVDFCH